MRLHLIAILSVLASFAAACSVSPGVDSAAPQEPTITVAEINGIEPEPQIRDEYEPFGDRAAERFGKAKAATPAVNEAIFQAERAERASEGAHVD